MRSSGRSFKVLTPREFRSKRRLEIPIVRKRQRSRDGLLRTDQACLTLADDFRFPGLFCRTMKHIGLLTLEGTQETMVRSHWECTFVLRP
jgi:hypothetical protein